MKKLGFRISLCCTIIALISCFGLASCSSSESATPEEAANANVYLQGTTNLHIDGVYCYTEDDESTYILFSNEDGPRSITCDSSITPEDAFYDLKTSTGKYSYIYSAESFTTRANIDEGTPVDGGDLEVNTVEIVLRSDYAGITKYYYGTVQDDAIEFQVETEFDDKPFAEWESQLEESGVPMSDSRPETYTYSFIHVDSETTE
ncbi:MAG: hypothetical protein J5804_05560 [Eggerthellaceae bacterium]|nr:hypothetical protein [Eggerthellaceae bacterium]